MNAAYPKVNFWDNLIPLRGGLDGPQLAGWTPGPPAKGGLGCVLCADQMIPVDGGVSLAADVYTPKAKGPYPAILVFSAYNKELQSSGAPTGTNETGSPSVFTSRGYARVVLARRGMGRSQGESVIFFNDTDVEDHAKTIAWAAEQPWCDSNVVLFGTSYYGITQPQVAAAKQPPALKGSFTIEMCTDYFRHIVRGAARLRARLLNRGGPRGLYGQIFVRLGRMAATMRLPLLATIAISVSVLLVAPVAAPAQDANLPHLEKRGITTQLMVDGQPFLMLAGELHNSSSSSLEYMKPIWPRLAAIPLNTVLTPVSWELIEPAEGKYDFTLIDGLLAQAREQHLRVVLLWLAAWKNGMSSYAPVWVKQDTKRFPRVLLHNNEANILSSIAGFSDATRDADARAFAAVMQHIREVDVRDHTVIMMQVENEVGILGDSRDHSPAAEQAFASAVPPQLTDYLKVHRDTLDPELRELWRQQGEKTSGTWAQVFGDTSRADEIFMAWNYARYIQALTTKGKASYELPMYVNTWLASEGTAPGDYPSGGPQPRVIDIWKAAGSATDIYSPDIYLSNFSYWANRYHRSDNPLFIPETSGGSSSDANVFYAFGENAAIGFSPFAIDSFNAEQATDLGASYSAIASVAPILLEQQSKGNVHGFSLSREHPSVECSMNGYTLHISLDEIFGDHSEKGFGLIIATGQDEFLGVGKGFRVLITTRASSPFKLGYASIDEGIYDHGKWRLGRRLNGDENDQGNYWRFDAGSIKIEKAVLYRYK